MAVDDDVEDGVAVLGVEDCMKMKDGKSRNGKCLDLGYQVIASHKGALFALCLAFDLIPKA